MMNETISQSRALAQELQEIYIQLGNNRRQQLKPNRSLIKGPGEDFIKIGAPLYKACIECDWMAAKAILFKYPGLVRYSITENGETALHVAAAASVKESKYVGKFVKNLIGMMDKADLELVNDNSNTALCLAAASGNIEVVRIMLNETLSEGQMMIMPLCTAVLFGKYEVVKFLYEKSNNLCDDDGWNFQNRGWLLKKCVETDMFDVALKIVKSCPQLGSESVLEILARKPGAFYVRRLNVVERISHSIFALTSSNVGAYEKETEAMQLLKIIWENIAKKPREEIYAILTGPYEQRSFHVLFIAAETGNTKLLVELIRQYPDLMLKTNNKNQTIVHIAVKERHEGIYNLLYEIGTIKDMIITLKDDDGNNMLHLAAKVSEKERPQNFPGAVAYMQRELLWFEEVWNMIPPLYREQKNKDGLTAREMFTKEHKVLVKEGGYNQDNGIPIFYQKPIFVVFIVADAISLILSSTSILIFLSIITSSFGERDFLETLPKKLGVGISNLFLSIAAMMVTYIASLFILYHKEIQWIPIFIGVFGSLPIFLYAIMQYHLLVDAARATYRSRSSYCFISLWLRLSSTHHKSRATPSRRAAIVLGDL
ncbi:hypothetical protein QVD17_15696 [Tagetes erecta]|uniref:PGG domain-containing protein n=1 Tax=Tagetes erecta TaxID=13708 RepID=A0AAD8KQL7_TARER|nr:hypothetical protein QVD17_15696 [Tagetes erecta]